MHQSDQTQSSATQSQPPKIELCKDFLRGKCKFGISGQRGGSCPSPHPNVCLRHLHNGAHKGGCDKKKTGCQKFHVRVCSRSYKEKECFNPRCKAPYHLKNTKRKKEIVPSIPTVWNSKPDEKQNGGVSTQQQPFLGQTRLEELEKNVKLLTSLIPMLLATQGSREMPGRLPLNW